MKKAFLLFLCSAVFVLNSFCTELEDIVENYLNHGHFVKIEHWTTVAYYPSHIITLIEVSREKLRVVYLDRNNDYESEYFTWNKDHISTDENGNLILKKK